MNGGGNAGYHSFRRGGSAVNWKFSALLSAFKGKYDEYMEYVDKERVWIEGFLFHSGLWRSEHGFPESKRPMQLQTVLARHKNTVYQKILEIRGPKDASFTILSMVVTGRRQRFYLVRCFH